MPSWSARKVGFTTVSSESVARLSTGICVKVQSRGDRTAEVASSATDLVVLDGDSALVFRLEEEEGVSGRYRCGVQQSRP